MTANAPPEQAAERVTERIFLGICLGLTAVIAFWTRNPDFLSQRIGLGRLDGVTGWAWLFALLVAVLYCAYTLLAIPDVRRQALRWSRLKVLGIWAAVGSGIVEEVVFRHLLMDALQANHIPIVLQVLASALAFGLVHAAWALLARDWRIALPVIASTAALGALLALLYLASDRSTLPAIAAHTTINLVIEPWLILAAVTGAWRGTGNHR